MREGTRLNGSPKLGIGTEIRINKRFNLYAGYWHIHFSNGDHPGFSYPGAFYFPSPYVTFQNKPFACFMVTLPFTLFPPTVVRALEVQASFTFNLCALTVARAAFSNHFKHPEA